MEPCPFLVSNTKSIVGILQYYNPQYEFQYTFYHKKYLDLTMVYSCLCSESKDKK